MGGKQMPDERPAALANSESTAEIVAAYVRRNQVGSDQLPSLIATVHQALVQLGKSAAEATSERTPVVSARRSVHRDYVMCMTCGWRGSLIRRHLTTAHGQTIAEYRASWNLTADHAMVAPAYSERRSAMAKHVGLGRTRGASAKTIAMSETETATATPPTPKRRGRPRSVAASA
jgi:predicted transcriptional regulator